MVVCVKNINEACYGKTIMWYLHLSFDKGMGSQLETAGTYREWEVGTEEERRGGDKVTWSNRHVHHRRRDMGAEK